MLFSIVWTIPVTPVVDDSMAIQSLKDKPYFTKKE